MLYNDVVGAYQPFLGKKRLVALGTDIDGTIAAVKKMASAGGIYFNSFILIHRPTLILDRHDLTALGVLDILHNPENRNSYHQNTAGFKNAVAKTLGGNTFDIAIRLVNTTLNHNVTLRVKSVNSEFSQAYKDAVIEVTNE